MTQIASTLVTKSVIFMRGNGAGPSARPVAENWPLVFPELLGRLRRRPNYFLLCKYEVTSSGKNGNFSLFKKMLIKNRCQFYCLLWITISSAENSLSTFCLCESLILLTSFNNSFSCSSAKVDIFRNHQKNQQILESLVCAAKAHRWYKFILSPNALSCSQLWWQCQ